MVSSEGEVSYLLAFFIHMSSSLCSFFPIRAYVLRFLLSFQNEFGKKISSVVSSSSSSSSSNLIEIRIRRCLVQRTNPDAYLVFSESLIGARVSDSGEPKTSVQESKSREGEMTKNFMKRILDADEDEGSKNESFRLENLKKKVAKHTSRKLENDFDPVALPLHCSICKKPFLDPVVTKCHHYFCEKCALKHHTENNDCFVCNEPTLGVFSTAVEVKKRIDEERAKARAMVKEVSEMVGKASAIINDAKGVAEKAEKMVAEIETMVEKVAAMATKAAEMVQEAEATMETAKANMAKALAVMKTVVWNV